MLDRLFESRYKRNFLNVPLITRAVNFFYIKSITKHSLQKRSPYKFNGYTREDKVSENTIYL